MGSLKMHDNEPVCTPISLFHWDAISGIDDNDNEYPVYLQVIVYGGDDALWLWCWYNNNNKYQKWIVISISDK